MNARILINGSGGSAQDRGAIEKSLAEAGLDGDVRWLDGGAIEEAARKAVEDGVELIVAGGGDGTISTIAAVVAGSQSVLGVLPLGTLNHFARDLGLPTDIAEAAGLLKSGKPKPVDLAEVNGQVFINNSAIGLYPLMVSDREAQQKRLGRAKRLAMLVAAARTLFRFSAERLNIHIAGQSATVRTPLLFVGNNAYRLEVPGCGTREKLDQGELFVIWLKRESRLGFLLATAKSMLGREGAFDVVSLRDVKEIKVDSARPRLRVSLDGETTHLDTPMTFKIRPKALRVIAP